MDNYVVIDVETSGLSPDNSEIIKLSALKILKGKISERFFKLIKPTKPLTAEVEKLTGITNEDSDEKHQINDLLLDFLIFIGDNTLVAHNIDFNVKFISTALKKANMPPLKNKTVDTLSLVRDKYKANSFSLRSVAKLLGVSYKNLTDCEIVFQVCEKLKEDYV